eukprot:TRINITY_DN44342_c0_g1_i1.p1 TRINITY_DN44342_c0_g1~~TRINITY_DN44342_c0_g1_i1.p1  ORF type:complete len:468 (+),score=43.20 TRINITY_DN44342_c0_g1_i1:116-1405(+)
MAVVLFSHAAPHLSNTLLQLPERIFSIRGFTVRVQQAWVADGRGGTSLGFGASVYPPAIVLAHYLAEHEPLLLPDCRSLCPSASEGICSESRGAAALQRPDSVSLIATAARVCELGCGPGLVGVTTALCGAGLVVVTDGDLTAVGLTRRNLRANGVEAFTAAAAAAPADAPRNLRDPQDSMLVGAQTVAACRLLWGDVDDLSAVLHIGTSFAASPEWERRRAAVTATEGAIGARLAQPLPCGCVAPYDMVVASDVVACPYREAMPALVETLRALVTPRPPRAGPMKADTGDTGGCRDGGTEGERAREAGGVRPKPVPGGTGKIETAHAEALEVPGCAAGHVVLSYRQRSVEDEAFWEACAGVFTATELPRYVFHPDFADSPDVRLVRLTLCAPQCPHAAAAAASPQDLCTDTLCGAGDGRGCDPADSVG